MFVSLVDEPRQLVQKRISIHAFNVLRRALLDETMLDKNNLGFRVSMAMTGVTDSDRLIGTMPLPTNVNVDDMYTQWLPAHLPQLSNLTHMDDSTEPLLKALLSLTASIPRTTELLVEVLQDEFSTAKTLSFTMATTTVVLQKLFKLVEAHYDLTNAGAIIMLDNAQLVHSILWGKHMKWSEHVNRAMIDGYLIYPPDKIHEVMAYVPAIAAP